MIAVSVLRSWGQRSMTTVSLSRLSSTWPRTSHSWQVMRVSLATWLGLVPRARGLVPWARRFVPIARGLVPSAREPGGGQEGSGVPVVASPSHIAQPSRPSSAGVGVSKCSEEVSEENTGIGEAFLPDGEAFLPDGEAFLPDRSGTFAGC
jgi:hypothetical protein